MAIVFVSSCAQPDNRFQSLIRKVLTPDVGFITRHSLSIHGPFDFVPRCETSAGVELTTVARGDWFELAGIPTAGSTTDIRCESPTEIIRVSARTLASTETIVNTSGFSAQGELVSGAFDCYAETRTLDYHRGTGHLLGFGSGRFPCLSEYDGEKWRSTRLSSDIRDIFGTSPSSDYVSFTNGATIAFDEAINDSGKSLDQLRMWSCPGDCAKPSSWTSSVDTTMPATGLAAAVSEDGANVAVTAIVTSFATRRVIVRQCAAGSACSDIANWSKVTLTPTLISGALLTEARFDTVGNLWVLIPNNAAPAFVCPAASFPCNTTGAWSSGTFLAGASQNYVQMRRPAFRSSEHSTRLVGPVRGTGLSADSVFAAECTASDCTPVASSAFSNFATTTRSGGLFPMAQAFFHLSENGIAAHYQLATTPFSVRWKGCTGAFGICSDPRSAFWSTAEQLDTDLDFDDQAKGQQRGFTDARGDGAAFVVDQEEEKVILRYLTPD